MYTWIWRTLPGGLPGKLFFSLVLIALAVAALFFYVFPAIEPRLPFNEVTVDGQTVTDPAPQDPAPSG